VTPPSGTETDPSHKLAGEATVQAEQLFRVMFEQAAVGIALIETATGRFLRVNHRYCEIVGLSADEMTATTFMAITHPDDLQADLDNMEELKAGRIRNFSMVKRYFRSDGSTVWVDLTVSPMWEPGEQPTFHIAVVQDITERKRAQEALRLTESRLTEILDNSTAMIFMKDPEGRYLLVNRAFERGFGLKAEQILGKTDVDIFSAGQAALFQANDRAVIRSGRPMEFEEVAQCVDGEHVSIVTKFPLRNVESSIYAVCGIVTDITERKQAEQHLADLNATLEQQVMQRTRELEESRQQLQAIVDGTSDAVFVKDLEGRYRLFNRAAERFAGKSQDEVIGRDDRFIFSPTDAQVLMEADRNVIAGGTTTTYEDIVTTADGVQRTFLSTKGPLFDGQGHVTGLFGISREITARKQVEEKLRLSEERLRLAQKSAHIGVWEWNVRANQLTWTPELEALYGLDTCTVRTYEDFSCRVHPDDLDRIEVDRNAAVRNRQPFDLEFRIIRPTGEIRWVSAHGGAVYDEAGQPIRVFGNNRDITERKQAEKALRESEERLRLALEGGDLGSWDVDMRTGQARWNRRHALMQGYEPVDGPVTIQKWLERVHPEDVDRVMAAIARAMRESSLFAEEHRLFRADNGEERWLSLYGRFSYDEAGEPVRFNGVSLDITDRKQAEEVLHQLNETLEQRVAERTEALRASEAFNREVLDSLSAYVVVLDASGVIVAVNRAWERAALCNDPLELAQVGLGANYVKVCERAADTSPEAREVLEGIAAVLEGRQIVFEREYLWIWRGYKQWFSMRVTPLSDRGGCVIVHEDVTERKQAEEAVRASEERFRSFFENAAIGAAQINPQKRFLHVNDRLCQITGYTRDELLTMGPLDLDHPDEVEADRKRIREFFHGKTAYLHYEKRYVHKAGYIVWVRVTVAPIRDDRGTVFTTAALIEDITERKRAEEALRDSYQRLQVLSREVQVAKEGERSRLSRELHDEFGQVLSGLKLELTTVTNSLSHGHVSTAVRMKMKKAIGMVDRLFVSLREMVSALRPSILDELGLVPALEAFVSDIQEQSDLHCNLVTEQVISQPRWGPEIESALFRIVQELLTNVIRHAKATTVTIALGHEDGQIMLTVRDNGRGFDVCHVGRKNRFGLRGVQERAELLGGTITIDSTRKVGTTVTVRIPVELSLPNNLRKHLDRPRMSISPRKRPRRGH